MLGRGDACRCLPGACRTLTRSTLTRFDLRLGMINTLLLPELREMLATNDVAGLVEFCDAMHPARAAEFMEGLTPEETWRVLQAADPAAAGRDF